MAEHFTSAYPWVVYGTVIALALAESGFPRRIATSSFEPRWVTNITLYFFSIGIQRLLMPASAIVVANVAARPDGTALFPEALTFVTGVLLLDAWKYAEHRLMHHIPALWRLHMVHHSDVDVDFTTTERHHPLESLISTGAFLLLVYIVAIPPAAVAFYVVAATTVAFFSHANLRLPWHGESRLGLFIVTPSVHTIHHSARQEETDSNFGILLTLWDRLFGTWRTTSPEQDQNRELGLEYFRSPPWARLDNVLRQPFASINERVR